MKTKRKNIWKVVIFSLVGIAILFSFIPVGGVMHGLSDAMASYHVAASSDNGGMGGYAIDHSASNVIFFILMTMYLSAIVVLSYYLLQSFRK